MKIETPHPYSLRENYKQAAKVTANQKTLQDKKQTAAPVGSLETCFEEGNNLITIWKNPKKQRVHEPEVLNIA